MSGPTRPSSGGTPRQPWTPDQAPKGVTCPACGLANEAGARTCRNCGLPIASASDPLRGVAPGHVDMPSTQRSGLSAAFGLFIVIGLLLVGGTLAVSGGGILSSGGRLVSDSGGTPAAVPVESIDPLTGEIVNPVASGDPGAEGPDVGDAEGLGTSIDYTCDDGAIKDLSKGKWFLSDVQAGTRIGVEGDLDYDQVYWKMTRQPKKAKKATVVTMEWTTPKDAQQEYDIGRVPGNRALVVTFDGPVDITAGSVIEANELENEGIAQIRKVQLFDGKDKRVHTVIGMRSDSCARLSAVNWAAKSTKQNAQVRLDIERLDAPQ